MDLYASGNDGTFPFWDHVRFSLTPDDVSSNSNAALRIDLEAARLQDFITGHDDVISVHSGLSPYVTLDGRQGEDLEAVSIDPGATLQRDTIDPGLFAVNFVPSQYEIDLFGAPTGSYMSAIQVGNLTLSMDTTGMTPQMILRSYASEINDSANSDMPFHATVTGNHMTIDGGTTADAFSAYFDDPGLDNTFGVQTGALPANVPEPSTLLMSLVLSGAAGIMRRRTSRMGD